MTEKSDVLVAQGVVLIGAVVSAAAEWLLRPVDTRQMVLAAFSGAWLAMGLQAILQGRLALRGRHGSATTWLGASARSYGALMSVAAVVWYFAMRRIG